jgi:hypothetical protein
MNDAHPGTRVDIDVDGDIGSANVNRNAITPITLAKRQCSVTNNNQSVNRLKTALCDVELCYEIIW